MVRAFEEIYDVYLEREVYVQKLGLKIYIYIRLGLRGKKEKSGKTTGVIVNGLFS